MPTVTQRPIPPNTGYQIRAGHGCVLMAYPAIGHDELASWRSERHALTFYLGVRIGRMAFESDTLNRRQFAPYTVLYRPPGADFVHDCQHAADIIELHLDDALFEATGWRADLPMLAGPVPRLARWAQPLMRLLYGNDGEDRLAVESASVEFAAQARTLTDRRVDVAGEARRLDRARLERVLALVDERLDAPLALADLADEVDLNLHHFAKAFKATTGCTPHEHITHRRTSRARLLLETTRTGIADIALECGFSSQSHLTAQFRRRVGVTPARYRAARRADA